MIPLVWLASGLVMILLELVIPGGIIVFLGGAAIIVAAGIYLGLITNVVTALITFFISSILLLLVFRSLFMKYFEGDYQVHQTDEQALDIGKIVEVIETIYPHKEGRVRFRATTWLAQSESEIIAGKKAVIVEKKESVWVVKPL
jgi:membrane protein implicated in regulation of membrane protease activity